MPIWYLLLPRCKCLMLFSRISSYFSENSSCAILYGMVYCSLWASLDPENIHSPASLGGMGVPWDSSGAQAHLSLCFTALPVRKVLKPCFRRKSCFWKGWDFWSNIIVCLLCLRKLLFLRKQNKSSVVFIKQVNFDILLQHWLQLEWTFYMSVTTEHKCSDVYMLRLQIVT